MTRIRQVVCSTGWGMPFFMIGALTGSLTCCALPDLSAQLAQMAAWCRCASRNELSEEERFAVRSEYLPRVAQRGGGAFATFVGSLALYGAGCDGDTFCNTVGGVFAGASLFLTGWTVVTARAWHEALHRAAQGRLVEVRDGGE